MVERALLDGPVLDIGRKVPGAAGHRLDIIFSVVEAHADHLVLRELIGIDLNVKGQDIAGRRVGGGKLE